MADPLAGAVLAPIGGAAADPLAGAKLAPIAAPAQPSLPSRVGNFVLNSGLLGGIPQTVKMVQNELRPRPDPAGVGRPVPTAVGIAEDIGGGLLQGGGAAIGGAVGGPIGAVAGAGAGAAADDILNAKINQQLYGHGYQPTIKGLAGTAAIGGLLQGMPEASRALQESRVAGMLTKAGTEAADTAESKLYKEELPAVKAEYESKVGKATETQAAGVEAAKAAARGEVAKNLVPKAAQIELENFVGRTPAEAEAARNAPEQWFARRRAQMANATVWNPMNKLSDELGQQFELAAPQEILVKPAGDLGDINKSVEKEIATMHDKGLGQVSPKVGKLVNALQQTGDSDWGVVAAVEGSKEANRLLKGDPAALEQRAALNRRVLDQMREKGISPPVPQVTNADLLNFRRLASGFVGTQDGPSSVAASTIRDAIDSKLEANGIKIPPDLNMRYKLYKDVFSPAFRREVAGAVHPEEYADKIFTEPQRFKPLWARADAGDKVALKNLFADYAVSLGPEKIGKLVENGKIDRSTLKSMFGDSAYARVQPWLDSDAKAMGWEQFMARATPQMRQQAGQEAKAAMEQAVTEQAMKGAKAIAGAGKDLARSLGPAGTGIVARLNAAKNPIEAARIVRETFAPILQDVPEIMPDPTSPAMTAYHNSKAIQDGLNINAKREAAAVARITEMAKKGDPLTKGLAQRAKFYVPLVIALSATGTVSPYLMAAGGYAALGALLFGPRRAMLRALVNDEAATLFYRGIKMSANSLNAKSYGRLMGEAAAKLAVRSAGQHIAKGMGLSADIPPEGEEK